MVNPTIKYCGDSFCTGQTADSYCVQLASLLDVKIVGFGQVGTAHEHAIQSFDSNTTYTVFCWTEPHRLYHKQYALNMNSCEALRNQNSVYSTAYNYFKYLHNFDISIERQIRDLYWFDREILSKYKGQCVHLWSFNKTYDFIHGTTINTPLSTLAHRTPLEKQTQNHLDSNSNRLLATKLYNLLRN